jgi:hypothetical protein
MDIWRLERPTSPPDSPWKAQLLNVPNLFSTYVYALSLIAFFQMHGFETGRYRLETVVHGKTLFTFGGGAPEFCAEFNEVSFFK